MPRPAGDTGDLSNDLQSSSAPNQLKLHYQNNFLTLNKKKKRIILLFIVQLLYEAY